MKSANVKLIVFVIVRALMLCVFSMALNSALSCSFIRTEYRLPYLLGALMAFFLYCDGMDIIWRKWEYKKDRKSPPTKSLAHLLFIRLIFFGVSCLCVGLACNVCESRTLGIILYSVSTFAMFIGQEISDEVARKPHRAV